MAKSRPNKKQATETPAEVHQRIHREGSRETVESIVVAIVLALLFRAFVAEAFVIPTGSMAPALKGAHKDIHCAECGQPFQIGASSEDKTNHALSVVAGTCPNCRFVNLMNLAEDANHATFNGDRILVSKFAYALSDPKRWDVIVFKYPGNPKQNYIKRLVGLPNETLRIRFGDIFMRPNSGTEFDIVRKPHDKLMAMAHHVHDTAYQSASLVEAGYPDNWQPWRSGAVEPPTDSWSVKRTADSWTATLEAPSDETKWIRYYHRIPTMEQWSRANSGLSITDQDPYSSHAIMDFYAYDSYALLNSSAVYDVPPGDPAPSKYNFFQRQLNRVRTPPGFIRADYPSNGSLMDLDLSSLRTGQSTLNGLGNHWVGDLILEADVEATGESGELVLELVESAILFQCRINLSDGKATLKIIDLEGEKSFAEAGGAATAPPTADTGITSGARHTVRFANCDDALYLWVDDSPVLFDQPTTYDMSTLRLLAEQHPMTLDQETLDRVGLDLEPHPCDSAPAGIGTRGASATVFQAKLMRDKYYVAINRRRSNFVDYNSLRLGMNSLNEVPALISDPENWANLGDVWESRRSVEFRMDEDQFFPMGDNSPESLDARCWVSDEGTDPRVDSDAYLWADAHYVPREMLVGKALMVFWPHHWTKPLPVTPNFKRIGFIR